MLDTFTIICCSIILLAFAIAWAYINLTDDNVLPKKRRWIEQLPSIISTLGVLGTFLGITKGLMYFDTSDLDNSIPKLLDGMKTAFFTSVFGMMGSLILNRVVSHKFDKSKQPSDTDKAAKDIVTAIEANQNLLWEINQKMKTLPDTISKGNEDMVAKFVSNDTVKAIHSDLQQIKDDVEIIKGEQQKIERLIADIKTISDSGIAEQTRLRAVALTATESISTIDNSIADLKDVADQLNEANKDVKEFLENSKG